MRNILTIFILIVNISNNIFNIPMKSIFNHWNKMQCFPLPEISYSKPDNHYVEKDSEYNIRVIPLLPFCCVDFINFLCN